MRYGNLKIGLRLPEKSKFCCVFGVFSFFDFTIYPFLRKAKESTFLLQKPHAVTKSCACTRYIAMNTRRQTSHPCDITHVNWPVYKMTLTLTSLFSRAGPSFSLNFYLFSCLFMFSFYFYYYVTNDLTFTSSCFKVEIPSDLVAVTVICSKRVATRIL